MEKQRAIELIEKSERLLILMPAGANLDCLTATEVLAQTLEARGKNVGFILPAKKDSLPRPDLFKKISGDPLFLKELIISVNTKESPVSELRYEKDETGLHIFLSPQTQPLNKNLVSFREGKILCDLLLTVGLPEVESIGQLPETGPEFLTEKTIINIDHNEANKNYGEINLVDTDKSSLGEIIYELITALEEKPLDKNSATLILAGLLSQTSGFTSSSTKADTLLVASELMRLGANHSLALELTQKTKPLNLLQLFGRASIRSKVSQTPGILWSFVTAEDFEKTGREKQDLPLLIEHLDKNLPPRKILALLWEDPEEKRIQTVLAGNSQLLQSIQAVEDAEFQSPYLKLKNSFASFREAEEYLTPLFEKNV